MPERIAPDLVSRRTLAGLAAAAGVGVPLLAACGNDPSSGAGSDSGSGSGGDLPVPTSDIEVGGGTIFADQKVVVTQPTEGEFKAFSAICTHQGCAVSTVENGTINCPCHGSEFAITDGSVVAGPAPKPLPAQAIKVSGGSITAA